MKAMDVCLRHLFTILTKKIKPVLIILCRSHPCNFPECSVLLFSPLVSSFCWREPWLLMRAFCRCLASINQVLTPYLCSWRSSPWTLSRLKQNKQQKTRDMEPTHPGTGELYTVEEKSSVGWQSSLLSLAAWERLSLIIISTGYFMAHGWLLSYLALT